MPNSKNEDRKIKILYIVVSIVFSIALWTYVAYVDNPEVQGVTIYGIKVNFTGEDLVNDKGLVITSIDTDSLSVSFSGKRNTVSGLSNSNVTATVDLTDILSSSATTGVYQLAYKLNYSSLSANSINSITVDSASKNYITVNVEKMVTKTVQVKAFYNGGVASGYSAEMPQVSMDSITVSGSQDLVSSISYASVTLERENLSKSVSEQVEVKLIDEDGNEIDKDKLILSNETVTVSVSVLMVKDIPLEINLIDGNSATSANTTYTIEPKYVTLSGDPDTLSDINSINLGTIDLTSFISTFKETYSIIIPNDVNNISGEISATVSVEVLNTETRRLSATNINVRNADGVDVGIITQSLDVTVRGQEADLEQITSENIRIVADLSEIGNVTGTFAAPAKIYVDGFNTVDAVGEYWITVVIS